MTDGFDLGSLLDDFVSECRESADLAVQDVLNLEQVQDQDSIDRIFRALHSIKGNASMFGLLGLSEFVHKVEDACSDIRSGDRSIDKLVINILLKSFDLVEEAFEHIVENGSDNINYTRGYELLKELAPEETPPRKQNAEAASAPEISQEAEPARAPESSKATPETGANIKQEEPVTGVSLEMAETSEDKPEYDVRKKPTALVVDDDFANRKVFVTLLSKYMPCYVAKDGVEAIQAVTESLAGHSPRFDVIIMDIMMPNIDGLQACKAIRQIERSKNLDAFDKESKIFIVSALSEESTIHKAMYECGADSYIVKPLRFAELRQQLIRFRLIAPDQT